MGELLTEKRSSRKSQQESTCARDEAFVVRAMVRVVAVESRAQRRDGFTRTFGS